MFNSENSRADVHPLAMVDSEYPLTECATCGMPVPMERDGDIYCDKACENKALEEALWMNAIEEAKARGDIFAQLFPEIVAAPEPGLPICSCAEHCNA